MPDPKWLEILKASGWQTAAVSAACLLFVLAGRYGVMPRPDAIYEQAAVLAFLVCGLLAIASIAAATFHIFPILDYFLDWRETRALKNRVRTYIEHMTDKERQIIGYLLAKNQKIFTVDSDGGYAATLISAGIVVRALTPGQVFTLSEMPVMVPDDAWQVLSENRDKFPYKAPKPGETETHPWRVSWMARI